MKPFLLGILKCKKCSFMTRLALDAAAVETCSVDLDAASIFNRHLFAENSGERLRLLAQALRIHPIAVPSDAEIDAFVDSQGCDAEIKALLFGVDVVDGVLTCEACGLQYPIRNSIVETVDVGSNKQSQ